MKQKLQLLIGASAASILAFSALAQDTSNPKTDGPDHVRDHMSHARANRLNGAAKASEIMGMTVKNYEDEKLGKVEDLALDVEAGRIVQVIISTGGFIGIGETLVAVPPGALHHDVTNKILHLDVDKEKLKGAPRFDNAKWDEGTQSNRLVESYAYYGQQPYFVANTAEYGTTKVEGASGANLPRNLDGTINTDAASSVEKAHNVEVARNLGQNNNTLSIRNPDGSWSHKYYPNGDGTNHSWSPLGYVEKASRLIGTPVNNLQDEKLGKIENLAIDVASGRIIAVIISSGGFLGMGDELSAVPPAALQFNAKHDVIQLDTSKAMLASSPHFKANQWPDLSQPDYTAGVYRAYKVEPYFTTDADNTRENVRDRGNSTLTPLNQGNSSADLNTTAQIRKEIIAQKGFSMNARNVKIITINGQVTLRGPVNSAEERRLIGEIADRIAQPGNVDNELETKLTTSSN